MRRKRAAIRRECNRLRWGEWIVCAQIFVFFNDRLQRGAQAGVLTQHIQEIGEFGQVGRGRYFVAGRNSLIPVNGFRCFAAGVITLDVDASSVLVSNFRRYCEPFKAAFFKPTPCSLLTPPPMELPRPMIKPRLVSGIPEALSLTSSLALKDGDSC